MANALVISLVCELSGTCCAVITASNLIILIREVRRRRRRREKVADPLTGDSVEEYRLRPTGSVLCVLICPVEPNAVTGWLLKKEGPMVADAGADVTVFLRIPFLLLKFCKREKKKQIDR